MRRALPVDIIQTSQNELDDLRELQIRYHFRFPAVFSCNRRGEVWLFRTYGYTRPEDRVSVSYIPLLRRIARVVLRRRRLGGRFFVTLQGVHTVLDGDQSPTLIALFRTSDAPAPRTKRSSRSSPPAPTPTPSHVAYESVSDWYRRMRKKFGHLWDSDW
jgi:hypothetical protein